MECANTKESLVSKSFSHSNAGPEFIALNSSNVVLVAGGAGYVGSHACKALAKSGYLPITYDDLSSGHEWAVKWGPLERGSILDRSRLDEVIARYRPASVMHFAAFSSVGESVTDPGKYYLNNVQGSLTLVEATRENGIGQFVFSSTCATYGAPDQVPIVETASQRPINPYGASKLMVERILADYQTAYGLRSIALRYFNAAGADPEGEIGEDHDPETHLIPLVLDAASGRRSHVTIFGTDYDTRDGTCVRDYVHVSDLASAHVKAIASLERGATSDVYNLGNGRGFSVREVVDATERISGRHVPIRLGERRAGDPAELICNAQRAREQLRWQPEIPDLDEIIRTSWTWHQRRSRGGQRTGALDAAE
jgi:UDP-arabinose 4-epimerase